VSDNMPTTVEIKIKTGEEEHVTEFSKYKNIMSFVLNDLPHIVRNQIDLNNDPKALREWLEDDRKN